MGMEEIFMNNVQLVGRTTTDAELRYTPNQKAVAGVTLAVNRDYKNANGEREADFIRLIIWGPSAENFANWIKKGYQVAVTGSIRTRSYDNQQGQRVYVTEVLVNSWQNLEPRRDNNGGNGQPVDNGFAPTGDFGSPLGGNPMDISDDDLPF